MTLLPGSKDLSCEKGPITYNPVHPDIFMLWRLSAQLPSTPPSVIVFYGPEGREVNKSQLFFGRS